MYRGSGEAGGVETRWRMYRGSGEAGGVETRWRMYRGSGETCHLKCLMKVRTEAVNIHDHSRSMAVPVGR
jgi:hypothetical protein